ncbi:MAG TPA: hypothetical protein HPP54_10565 [Nitrospinae bacterium]|nr:hypothetical protein [Nitrospinota bacterium]
MVLRELVIWRRTIQQTMRSTGTTVTVTRKTDKYDITYIQSTTPGNQGAALKELTAQIEADIIEAELE